MTQKLLPAGNFAGALIASDAAGGGGARSEAAGVYEAPAAAPGTPASSTAFPDALNSGAVPVNLTLAEVAARLRCRPHEVPLDLGDGTGIGYFVLAGRPRFPLVEVEEWERRNTVRPGEQSELFAPKTHQPPV